MREEDRERETGKAREAGLGCSSKWRDQGRPHGGGDL